MDVTEDTLQQAFGRGCDARLKGDNIDANPYDVVMYQHHKYWEMGWHDVDEFWGKWRRKGQSIPKLPKVK